MPRREEALGGVGERFPDPDDAAVIGWDQTEAIGKVDRRAKP
jgi:hypothetical protein